MKDAWTTGITVKNSEDGWTAECSWQCGDFAQSGYMEGIISTRYYEPTITQAIDYVLEFINRFGIKRSDEIECMKEDLGFSLYNFEDGELLGEAKEQFVSEATNRGWTIFK